MSEIREAMLEPATHDTNQSAELYRIRPSDLIKARALQSGIDLLRMPPDGREALSRVAATILIDHTDLLIGQPSQVPQTAFRVPSDGKDYLAAYYQDVMPGLDSSDLVRRKRTLRLQNPIIQVALDAAGQFPEIAAEDTETQFFNDDLLGPSQSMTALLTAYGQQLLAAQRFADQRSAESYKANRHHNPRHVLL